MTQSAYEVITGVDDDGNPITTTAIARDIKKPKGMTDQEKLQLLSLEFEKLCDFLDNLPVVTGNDINPEESFPVAVFKLGAESKQNQLLIEHKLAEVSAFKKQNPWIRENLNQLLGGKPKPLA